VNAAGRPQPHPGPVDSRRATSIGALEPEWVYPIYLVAETGSVGLPAGWNRALAGAVDRFLDEMAARPETGEAIAFASLLHGTAIWTERLLTPALNAERRSIVAPAYSTSYESLFRQLADLIEHGERRISAAGLRGYLPLVLLVIGQPLPPTDSWSAAWQRLVIDDEVQLAGSAIPRAMVVPVCVHPAAEATCRQMAYPPGTSFGYRANDVGTLEQLLVTVLTYAAKKLALLTESKDEPILPCADELDGVGDILAGDNNPGGTPASVPGSGTTEATTLEGDR
jgi:uncharacterized protein YegL